MSLIHLHAKQLCDLRLSLVNEPKDKEKHARLERHLKTCPSVMVPLVHEEADKLWRKSYRDLVKPVDDAEDVDGFDFDALEKEVVDEIPPVVSEPVAPPPLPITTIEEPENKE